VPGDPVLDYGPQDRPVSVLGGRFGRSLELLAVGRSITRFYSDPSTHSPARGRRCHWRLGADTREGRSLAAFATPQ
jgi:hypothetical protein